ncbi:hypothetical protein [uncultured Paracoccus sp.]|uniref:hypothetical protein n=1 Tax=uncultured Paracoccus sp. TaxID=189685 RepID=UPI00262377E2|nr:hypothetical protein [uncultured Paracoccus sp.]
MSFFPIDYGALNARQKEIYNFQKIAARLADYGYHSMWLSDDWQGADFLACHIDGATVLRIQLKARLTLDKKYLGKGLHIAFRDGGRVFVYPHDALLAWVLQRGILNETSAAWQDEGIRHWGRPPTWAAEFLGGYEVKAIEP